jgi:hypothetical protein
VTSLKVGFTCQAVSTQSLNVSLVVLATQTILSKIPPNNSKLTYVWEQFLFHYISEGGFTYLVMADDSAGRYVRVSVATVGKRSPNFRNVQENALHVPRRTPAQGTSFSHHCVLYALTVA